jgi:hypothetical protein
MAVVKANQTGEGRSASHSFEGHQYETRWVVVMDDKDDTAADALRAAGIPRIGDHHEDNRMFGWCQNVDAVQRAGSDVVWDVVCQYGDRPGEWKTTSDPTQDTPIVKWTVTKVVDEMMVDEEGYALLNACGVPFDPSVKYERIIPVCTITQNRKDFLLSWIDTYCGTLNGDYFTGMAPGVCKLANIAGSFKPYAYGGYWECMFEIHYDLSRDGWNKGIMNAGLHELKGETPETSKRVPIMVDTIDADGNVSGQIPTTEPIPLNPHGHAMDPQEVAQNPQSAWFIYYNRYRYTTWAQLRLAYIIYQTLNGQIPIPNRAAPRTL